MTIPHTTLSRKHTIFDYSPNKKELILKKVPNHFHTVQYKEIKIDLIELPHPIRAPNLVLTPENDRQQFQYHVQIVIKCGRLESDHNMHWAHEVYHSIKSYAF